MTTIEKKKLTKWGYALVAVAITAIAFSSSLSNGWTNWDDEVYVLNNENIKAFSWQKIKFWFGEYHHGNYHPLTMISYMWEYSIDKLNPKTYHTTNYFLHLLNTLLVFLFIYKLLGKKEIALVVATLFGVHPMHVESVAWISERKDVLYSAFYLGTLLLYLEYKYCPNWIKYLFLIILFIGSLLSKSAAVVLPVVLVLIDYYQERKWTTKTILEKIPFFILSIAFGVLAIKSQKATDAIASFDVFTTTQRILFAGYSSLIYVGKAIYPFDLTAFHPYPSLVDNGSRLPYQFYIIPVLAISVFGGVLVFLKKNRTIMFGAFFYLVNVALVLQFVSVGSAMYAERYSYVAYIGLFFLFAVGISYAIEQKKILKKPIYLLVTIVCIGLGFLTYQQAKTWKNTLTLWQQFNKVYPNINFGYVKLAEYYMDLGEEQKAFETFDYIVKKYPGSSKATMGRANLLAKKGEYELALKDYATALAINPNLTDVYVNRAIMYSILKQYDNAFLDYTEAIKRMPNNYKIYANRGFAYMEHGDLEKAIQDFSRVLQFEPTNTQLYFMRGLAYHRLSKLEQAIVDYRTVIQTNRNHKDAYHNIALCYEAKGMYKKAFESILRAQALGKKEDPTYLNKLKKLSQ